MNLLEAMAILKVYGPVPHHNVAIGYSAQGGTTSHDFLLARAEAERIVNEEAKKAAVSFEEKQSP